MDLRLVLPSLLLVAVLFVILPVGTAVFSQFRYRKRVTCPLGQRDAAVAVHAGRAAVGAVLGREMLRVRMCSLWDDHYGCAQACLPALATAPDDRREIGRPEPPAAPPAGGRLQGRGPDEWRLIMLC
jgi:hypothetical protein